jgi:hypothetical protein
VGSNYSGLCDASLRNSVAISAGCESPAEPIVRVENQEMRGYILFGSCKMKVSVLSFVTRHGRAISSGFVIGLKITSQEPGYLSRYSDWLKGWTIG